MPYVVINRAPNGAGTIESEEYGYYANTQHYGTLEQVIDAARIHITQRATAFLYRREGKDYTSLAIDTEPDEAWGEVVNCRQIIGTFAPNQFADIIQTYAPFL